MLVTKRERKIFEGNVAWRPDPECCLWVKGTTNGHGRCRISGTKVYAHIVSYNLYRGEVPAGHILLQNCGVKRCVNPAHMSVIDIEEHKRLLFESNFEVKGVDECWEWQGSRLQPRGRETGGYGRFYYEGVVKAHRMSYELYNGESVPSDIMVLHTCDNPPCVNPSHLFLGTAKDNARDKVSKGRSARGELNGDSRLTEKQVLDIREEYKRFSSTFLAHKYGVTPKTIYDIVYRRTWSHI